MPDSPKTDLQRELGGGPEIAAVVGRLSDQCAADYLAVLREARRRQDQELASAEESALRYVPKWMRGALHKMLLPEQAS